jgi:hypothetical protein
MDNRDCRLRDVLAGVARGETTVEDALGALRHLPFEDLGFARVDHHRSLRHGIPEVVFASGKRPEETIAIARAIHDRSGRALVTRATREIADGLGIASAVYHERAGVISTGEAPTPEGAILVLTAGTSDIPVAEEAAVTARFLGSAVETVFDAGVAGIHRLLGEREKLDRARVLIVVAGMEGALPSVVGGLTDRPIIAVPTSVGYGTSLGGLTALFAMLNSCVPGIAVVNIDNGFGAACLAHRINTLAPAAQ